MKCRYVKTLFKNNENGYCVFVYHTDDAGVPQSARNKYYNGEGIQFTAVGNSLPETDSVETDMQGEWVRTKYGTQLHVESFEEVLPQTAEGIECYLSSGIIKGIGPGTAKLIVGKYGKGTFDVFDHSPDSLLSIKGITQRRLDTIMESYHGSHAIRDLAAYLTPFKVTPKKIRRIYEQFGEDALATVRNSPFKLCQINGFGFITVDEIARANRCSPNDPMRIEGCIQYCMEQETQEGHVYQEGGTLQKKVYGQLNHDYNGEAVTEDEVYRTIYRMVDDGVLFYEDNAIYTAKLYGYECETAKKIADMLVHKTEAPCEIDALIIEAQRELGINLSAKQAEGVRKAFTNMVTIITGGPGTGKTTVQKALLYVHEKLGGKNALLTAPTGRASRRMAESTGHTNAVTMHSAMGLTNDEECGADSEMLEADFIIADEFTMSDMHLSFEFFRHIKKGTRIVLVGDINQLPSVGPGNVFRELVMCGEIPVTVLDTVFRQAENSRIAINAQKMQEDDPRLDYGAGFTLITADDDKEAADRIEELYRESVDLYGHENVQVLTPYRKRGEASAEALNARLWEAANPKRDGTLEIRSGRNTYRVGDRIIHNKNKNQINNGDIGYITDIYMDGEGVELAKMEFSDGRSVEYTSEEMDMVEHAYATTVHKSQGSEYQMVILPWLPMFYKMLRRNILYTAITRAKVQVAVIGNRKAVHMAVHNTECDRRNTRLGERLTMECGRLLHEQECRPPKRNVDSAGAD